MNARLLNRLALVIIVLAINVTRCYTPEPASVHFRVKISSPQQEADYTCDLIEGILYFKSRGYSPELPRHPLVDSLVQDVSIDPYLNHPDSWERLPEYVAQYVNNR